MGDVNLIKLEKKYLVFLFTIFLLGFVFAQETNLTDQEYSKQCLDTSKNLMSELDAAGFNTMRVNDTIKKAEVIYESQELLEVRGGRGEFSFTIESCNQIEELYSLAFESRDDVGVFKGFYNEVVEDGMDTSRVDAIVSEMEKEIDNERYEKVEELLERAYKEISDAQEEYGRLNRFYLATSRNLLFALREYGIYLGILLMILIVFYLAYRIKIKRILINRKINTLRGRKQSIKDLMSKTQKEYFSTGKISESDYQLRSKNFANLIRDIDRQIPLLEERLIKSENSKKHNERLKAISKEERVKERRSSRKESK